MVLPPFIRRGRGFFKQTAANKKDKEIKKHNKLKDKTIKKNEDLKKRFENNQNKIKVIEKAEEDLKKQ